MSIYIDLSKYDGIVRKCLSESVQKHAFDMGIGWKYNGYEIANVDKPYIVLDNYNDVTWLSYEDELDGANSELISAEIFLDMKKASFIKKYSDIVFADFSWVKGEARSVLIYKCINKAVAKGFVRIQYLNKKHTAIVNDNTITKTGLPYLCMNKSSKHIFTSENIPKRGNKIRCNDMIAGKY